MEWESGDDVTSGNERLSAPGSYHCAVVTISEPATKHDGSIITGTVFGMTLAVLAGTVPGQEDKTVNLTFFQPKPSSKDGGKMSRKKIDRALIAMCLMEPSDAGLKKRINLDEAVGRQLCVELELDQDGKFLTLSWANIFHVDDPEAANIPKNQEGLAMIPKVLRRQGMKIRGNGPGKATEKEVDEVVF